jgi:zinc protease
LVKKGFGGMKPAEDFKPVNVKFENALPASSVTHKQTAKPTGMVLVGYPISSIYEKEDQAAITLLDTILSGYSYPGGWLHADLREAGKLVYYVHGMSMTGPAPGYFIILSQTDPGSVSEVVTRIGRQIERARQGDIKLEEFELARQMVLALHAQDNTTISSQAQEAALNELYGLGFDYAKTYEARIQAVKMEDVVKVARKYLTKSVTVTSSPAEKSPVGAGE